MSAQDTNIEKQTRRHRPALWGMGFVMACVAVLFVVFLYAVATPDVDEAEALATSATEESN